MTSKTHRDFQIHILLGLSQDAFLYAYVTSKIF